MPASALETEHSAFPSCHLSQLLQSQVGQASRNRRFRNPPGYVSWHQRSHDGLAGTVPPVCTLRPTSNLPVCMSSRRFSSTSETMTSTCRSPQPAVRPHRHSGSARRFLGAPNASRSARTAGKSAGTNEVDGWSVKMEWAPRGVREWLRTRKAAGRRVWQADLAGQIASFESYGAPRAVA